MSLRLFTMVFALGVVLAIAATPSEDAGGFRVSEVHGVKTRSGRQLQQAFGASSIVPLVIDDSPCVSFNADDASPVLDSDGNIVGYTTVHSNNYDDAGLSILRLDVVILNFEIEYYFASVDNSSTNIRALLTTGLPNGCPTTTPAMHTFSQGITVDCSKRRATLDMSVPTSLFNCTTATTEDFSIVFFLQLEMDLAPQQCAASKKPFYAGGVYNAIPFGSGCSYVMVTAACRPSTCVVDTDGLDEAEQLNRALGSTGRIAGGRVQRASSAYDTGLTNVNAAVVGGLVGGVLLSAAVVIGYVLLKRSPAAGAAGGGHHARRSHSVASDYLDADRFDSFTIDTSSVTGGGGTRAAREARRASRLSSGAGRLYSMSRPSVLRAMGAGRWRDKFGTASPAAAPAADGAGSGAPAPPSSVAGDASVADGNQLLLGGLYPPFNAALPVAASAAGSVTMSGSPFTASNARIPSMFLSPRAPSVFAQPRNASMVGMPVPAVPSVTLGPGRSGMSMSRARRSSTLVTAAAVPMLFDRAAASGPLGGSASDGTAVPAELVPPDDVSSVFLNPLALLRGGKGKDRSGSSSPRMLSMATLSSAITGLGSATLRRTPPRGTLAAAVDDRSDGPLIRMIVEEEAQGAGGSSEGSTRQTATGVGGAAGGGGAAQGGGEPLSSPRTTPMISRRGGGSGGGRPGPVAESWVSATAPSGAASPRTAAAARHGLWPYEDLGAAAQRGGATLMRSPAASSGSGLDSPLGSAAVGSEGPRGSDSGSLRSILPRPPPLVMPAPVDGAAVAGPVSARSSTSSNRLSRPLRDMRSTLSSSSQASMRSLQSQASSRSVQARPRSGSSGDGS